MFSFRKILFVAILFVALFLRLLTLNQMGRTLDEYPYTVMGKEFIDLLTQGDFLNPYFIYLPDHPPLMRYIYGLGGQLDYNSNTNDYDYNFIYARLISVSLGVMTILVIMLLGWRFISPETGLFSGFILATIPEVLAMNQLATIESGTLFFFVLSLFFYLLLLDKHRKLWLILSGISLGLLLSVKFTNVLAVPIWIAIFFIKKWKQKSSLKLINLIWIMIIGGLIFCLLWPSAVVYPLIVWQKIYAQRFSETPIFQAQTTSLFLGNLQRNPISYFIIYFLISTPLLYLILFALGCYFGIKNKNWMVISLLLAFVIPFSQSLYDLRAGGIRYLIEIFIPFSLLAGSGLSQMINKISVNRFRKRWLYLGSALVLVAYSFFSLRSVSPYYLDYFNEGEILIQAIDGKPLFNIDLWLEGEKQIVAFLNQNASPGSTVDVENLVTPQAVALTVPPSTALNFEYHRPILVRLANGNYFNYLDKAPDFIVINNTTKTRLGAREYQLLKRYGLVYSVMAGNSDLADIYTKK